MGLIDFILNLAGVLLWLSWRSMGMDPLTRTTPATLVGTLRRAEPRRLKGWQFPVGLAALLLLAGSGPLRARVEEQARQADEAWSRNRARADRIARKIGAASGKRKAVRGKR